MRNVGTQLASHRHNPSSQGMLKLQWLPFIRICNQPFEYSKSISSRVFI